VQTLSLTGAIAVKWSKAGRQIILGKIVRLPSGELIFGTPYRRRRFSTPSLPEPVLQFLLDQKVQHWIVRLDGLGTAYELSLESVREVGVFRDGEWHVPFQLFQRTDWIEWPYATQTIEVH